MNNNNQEKRKAISGEAYNKARALALSLEYVAAEIHAGRTAEAKEIIETVGLGMKALDALLNGLLRQQETTKCTCRWVETPYIAPQRIAAAKCEQHQGK